MPLNIIDTLKPQNGQTFPVADSNDIKGGYHQVSSLEDRDNIVSELRSEGMTCYVISESKSYQLVGGILNTDWVEMTTDISIPIASDTVLGGIKVGSGLSINSTTGVLTATGGSSTGDYLNTVDDVSLSYTSNNSYYLSGVKHLNNNDIFTVNSTLSASSDITVNASQFVNLPPQEIASSNLVTSGSQFIHTLNHTISLPTDTYILKKDEFAEVRYNSWKPGYWKRSPQSGILIDTHSATASTPQHIYARDELKRYIYSSTTAWTAWDPSTPLTSSDAMVHNGVIRRQFGDWRKVLGNTVNYDYVNQTSTTSQFYYTGLHEPSGMNSNQNGVWVRCVCTKDGTTEPTWAELRSASPPLKIWISLDCMPGTTQYYSSIGAQWHNIFMPYTGDWTDGHGCSNLPTNQLTTTHPSDAGGWEITFESQYTEYDTGPDAVKWGVWVKIEFPVGSKATVQELQIIDGTWL